MEKNSCDKEGSIKFFSCGKGESKKCPAGGGIQTLPFRRGVTQRYPSFPPMPTYDCGIIGNEQADVLAKEGALNPLQEASQIPKSPPRSSSHSWKGLCAGGMSTGNPAWTFVRLSNGFLPFAKRLLSNFFGRAERNLVKRYS